VVGLVLVKDEAVGDVERLGEDGGVCDVMEGEVETDNERLGEDRLVCVVTLIEDGIVGDVVIAEERIVVVIIEGIDDDDELRGFV
jgi:hypothetical protein